MALVEKDGFKIFEKGESRFLGVDSSKIDSCMNYYLKNKFNGVWINPSYGYLDSDINFLKDFPFIEHIEITKELNDISGLYQLENIKYLLLDNCKIGVDFSMLPNLQHFRGDWNPRHKDIFEAKKITQLHLWKYKSKSQDLTAFGSLMSLETLCLVRSNITSLKGLSALPSLKKIELCLMANLEEIDEIENLSESLNELIFDRCKKIKNHEYVSLIKNLQVLAFNSCHEIKKIDFIKQLPKLEDFRFVNTNVSDGDLSWCIGLRNVGFLNKKNFSHTYEEIKKLSAKASSV